jgi:hypothetical protein
MRQLGGDVTERVYPGSGHAINEDEITVIRGTIDRIVAA